MPGDDKAKVAGELRLLDQTKGFSSIVYPAHAAKATTKERHHKRSLEGIVVDEKNGYHGALPDAPDPVKRLKIFTISIAEMVNRPHLVACRTKISDDAAWLRGGRYPKRNSLSRSSLMVSRRRAAFSNSNFFAASRMSVSSLAM